MLNVFLNRLEYRSSNPTFFPKSKINSSGFGLKSENNSPSIFFIIQTYLSFLFSSFSFSKSFPLIDLKIFGIGKEDLVLLINFKNLICPSKKPSSQSFLIILTMNLLFL